MKLALPLITIAATFVLSACGGGGGDGGSSTDTAPVVVVPPVVNPTQPALSTYSLQTAYAALVKAGSTVNYAVTGSCSGTASFAATPASSTTFNGVAAQQVTNTSTLSLTNCVGNSATTQSYYDSSFNLLGNATTAANSYGFVDGTAVLPAAATVGSSGNFGTLKVYSDSAKATQVGTIVLSYALATETSTTELFTLTSKSYNLSNTLLQTQAQTYRVQANGTLKPLSIDLLAVSPASHLVLTAN